MRNQYVYTVFFPFLFYEEVPFYFDKDNFDALLNRTASKSLNTSIHNTNIVCVLSVAEMIHITVQPQSQEATVGSEVALTCRASGPPGLNYQWFRGNEEVSAT